MLSFLNTTILIAAAAALIPLIIHLFFRRNVKIVEFSSLKHLKSMQRRQVRRLKIRQILLLLARMLIILLVVFAFARPTTEKGSLGSHASVSAVVLFDNSASMDRYVLDGNLFDLAAKRVSELLETFSESDEVAVIGVAGGDQADRYDVFNSAAVAAQKLQSLERPYVAAKLGGALDHTVDLLDRAINLNKEIYFVTDRQRHSLPDSAVLDRLNAAVYEVELPLEKNDNCGIINLNFGGQLILPGHEFTITARVKNYGTSDRDDLIASLFVDGSRVAQSDFTVAGGEEATVRFARSVARTGFHSGYVEISDDRFPADNRYYFSFRIPERFTLLIIDGDGSGELLALALSPSQNINQYWSVKTASPENLAGVNFWDYDVIFLAGMPEIGQTFSQRLKSFVSQGRSLFFTYSPYADIGYLNSEWSFVTGVTFERPAPQDPTRAGYYALQSFEISHPIFSVFTFENNQPPQIKFYSLPDVNVSDEAGVLMSFTGDRPALIENHSGRGRVLTFTGPIEARYSDISGHAFFVPLVSRVAEYLAADLSSYDLQLFCGDNITRPVSINESITAPLYLVTPDSSQYALSPQERQGLPTLRIVNSDQPGIYSITYSGREIDRFALNVDPAECDLTGVDTDQFAAAVGAKDIKLLPQDADLASVIGEYRHGRELWQLFLWLAVVLVIVEIFLSRGASQE